MYQEHEANIRSISELISGTGPTDSAERERLLWLLIGIHAGALTPVSENEKRGMDRVLAILDRKLGEGGVSTEDDYNRFYRGRRSAFRECAIMLRSSLRSRTPVAAETDKGLPNQYRKKPVVIEARQFDGSWATAKPILEWIGRPSLELSAPRWAEKDGGAIFIPTSEGEMRAEPGDFVIKGVKGEFYPCKPDIFAATYEPASPSTDQQGGA